ncbi:UNVERIFIED_CONTAM: hypothetical protein Scaly_1631100 [Sesamum calycinum]|uniref:RNase H type-1 domain-containing protein n=1 Tax=Sesamum calycinum TaxID=2727403 RepID=A0AAW2P9D6_9LAMI
MNVEPEKEITFSKKDLRSKTGSLNDPMVIKMDIENFSVHKVLVDNGSSADIIFWDVLRRMNLENANLDSVQTPFVGFEGSEVTSLGSIDLPVSIGDEPRRRAAMVKFLVVDTPFAYNVILEVKKKRSLGAEKNHIINEEVNKLVKAGYVSEVQFTEWLANVVVVPKHVMARPDASGRLIKWAVELDKHNIEYQNRASYKAQILTNFIAEFVGEQGQEKQGSWMLHVDGSSNANNGGARILLQGPGGIELEVIQKFSFATPNSEAEYETLILGLELAEEAGRGSWAYIRIHNSWRCRLKEFTKLGNEP